MQNSPVEPILLPQFELIAKLNQLTPFFDAICGTPRKSGSLKTSYEGASRSDDWEYWLYERSTDKRMLASWRQNNTTNEKEVFLLVDESGKRYLPGSSCSSLLQGE
jgi:hypothetical protein